MQTKNDVLFCYLQNLNEGMRLQQQLTTSLSQLEKSKKNYEKAFREAEKVSVILL